jgi:type I restriction enzyme, R subunit
MLEALKVPPISEHGNVGEIIGIFGWAERLKEAVDQLQVLLMLR